MGLVLTINNQSLKKQSIIMKTITQKESFSRLKNSPSLASTKFAERIINDCENARN